jgi:hypothetical protein
MCDFLKHFCIGLLTTVVFISGVMSLVFLFYTFPVIMLILFFGPLCILIVALIGYSVC